jgi:hypothetical protein
LQSRHQIAGQNLNLKISNRSFENVAQFKRFDKKSKNSKQLSEGNYTEEIEFRYRLLLFGSELLVFLSGVKNVKIRIYETINLPVVLYGYEA